MLLKTFDIICTNELYCIWLVVNVAAVYTVPIKDTPMLMNAKNNVHLTWTTKLALTFTNIVIFAIIKKEIIIIATYNIQLAQKTEQKYFFAASRLP